MDSTKSELDFSIFRKAIREEPTKENGWSLAVDSILSKDLPDCKVKVYKKIEDGETVLTTYTEAVLKNVKIENLFKMMTDTTLMIQADKMTKQIKVIEQLSKNSDIIYRELEFPFPFANRDFVIQRVYFSNEDVELARELGLHDLDHKFYLLMLKSTTRADYPARDKPVRGEVKLGYWLIEEDPNNPEVLTLKSSSCNHLNGNLPVSVVNKMGSKKIQEFHSDMIKTYYKLFGKE